MDRRLEGLPNVKISEELWNEIDIERKKLIDIKPEEIDVESKKFNDDRYQNGKASHYNKTSIEVFDMMKRIWGVENFKIFCEMNAFKYRMRIGYKDDPNLELQKIKTYESIASKI
tara:strand:+ start:87 stop:431 length:345 start_codon:yes stop_codon:yes gene_type:complete